MSKYEITVNGKTYVVEIGDITASPLQVTVNGEAKTVEFRETGVVSVQPAMPEAAAAKVAPTPPAARASAPEPQAVPQPQPQPAAKPAASAADGQAIKAPMPGKILSIRVKAGDKIKEGDTVCTLEAMKMEMPISATASGVVKAILVNVGDNVAFDDALVTVA